MPPDSVDNRDFTVMISISPYLERKSLTSHVCPTSAVDNWWAVSVMSDRAERARVSRRKVSGVTSLSPSRPRTPRTAQTCCSSRTRCGSRRPP